MRRIVRILVIAISIFCLSINYSVAQVFSKDTLTLDMAIKRALDSNPEIASMKKKIEVAEARLLQSGLIPNPQLSVDAENILGSNEFSGFRGSEITMGISQDIALSSKISNRVKVSEINVELMKHEYMRKRLEIKSAVRSKFVDLTFLSKLISRNTELLTLTGEFVENLQLRVQAGKISPAEVARAELILNSIDLNIQNIKSKYINTLNELGTLLNLNNTEKLIIVGDHEVVEFIPYQRLKNLSLDFNLELQKLKIELLKQKAVIDLEKSLSIPPINLFVGIKRLNELSANTFVLGTSIPLPVFDRNQGSINASLMELESLEKEYEALENNLKQKLKSLSNNLKILFDSAKKLKTKSLPSAEKAYEIIKKGNEVGRFTILDVLDAQRTLIEIENQYLNIVRNANKIIVEIETLINSKI